MKLSDLKVNPNNPRLIKDAKFKKLCNSVRDFPKMMALRPIVIDRADGNKILGGNMRYLALKALRFTDIPDEWVRDAAELTEDEKRRFIVEDNMPFGEWDMDILANSFDTSDLVEWGFDEKELGISPEAPQDAEPQIDKASELQKKWGTETGQLWLIGSHRLLVGDSTKAEDVERVMGGESPLLMITDPPYGVEYESKKGAVTNDDRSEWKEVYDLFRGAVAYVWHGERSSLDVGLNLRDSEFEIRARVIWVKPSITMGRGHYHFQHEGAWYAVRKGNKSGWIGDHKQSSVWQIDRDDKLHPTVKPLECMARPIRNHEGDVYDPFLGSGTTLIAAHNLNRKFIGIEISPGYVAVCLQRFEDAFGIKGKKIG